MASYGLYKYMDNKEDSLAMSQSEAVENNYDYEVRVTITRYEYRL